MFTFFPVLAKLKDRSSRVLKLILQLLHNISPTHPHPHKSPAQVLFFFYNIFMVLYYQSYFCYLTCQPWGISKHGRRPREGRGFGHASAATRTKFIIDLKKNIQKIAFFFLKRGPDTAYKNRPKCLEIKIKSTGTK